MKMIGKVLGVDTGVYGCLMDSITVHSQQERIDARFSPGISSEPPSNANPSANSSGTAPTLRHRAIRSALLRAAENMLRARVGKITVAREIVARLTEDNRRPVWVLGVRQHWVQPAATTCKISRPDQR